jgi:hypothetical protein
VTPKTISLEHGPWRESTIHKGEKYCERCLMRDCFLGAKTCEPHIVETTPAAAVPKLDMEKFDALAKKHARALASGSQMEWDVATFNYWGLVQFADALLTSAPTSTKGGKVT